MQAYQCTPIDAANPGVLNGLSTALQTPPKIGRIPPKQTSNDARSTSDLQTLGSTGSPSTPLMKLISLKIL
jgi:hypothetical protein